MEHDYHYIPPEVPGEPHERTLWEDEQFHQEQERLTVPEWANDADIEALLNNANAHE